MEMIYHSKKERGFELRPEPYNENKLFWWNKFIIPAFWIVIYSIVIRMNADLFYLSDEQYSEMMTKDQNVKAILNRLNRLEEGKNDS